MSDEDRISNRAGPGSAGEPSMEEILASIRRILKEDESAHPSEDPDDEILVLSAAMEAKPVDIASGTALPADTGPGVMPVEAPVAPHRQALHLMPEAGRAADEAEPDQEIIIPNSPEYVAEMEEQMDSNLQSRPVWSARRRPRRSPASWAPWCAA